MVIILVFCVFTTRATRWQHQFVPTAFKADVANTPCLHSDRANRLESLLIVNGLCQREPKVPELHKKHTATQPTRKRFSEKNNSCVYKWHSIHTRLQVNLFGLMIFPRVPGW